jgi:hypothetical protein
MMPIAHKTDRALKAGRSFSLRGLVAHRGLWHLHNVNATGAGSFGQFGANLEQNKYTIVEKSTACRVRHNDNYIANLNGTFVTASKHGHVIRILW